MAQRQHIVHGEVTVGAAAQQDLPRRVQVNRSDRPVMMTRTWAPAHTYVCWTRIAMHASSLSEDHVYVERKLTSFGCDLRQEHSKGFLCKRTCMARVTTLHLPGSLRVLSAHLWRWQGSIRGRCHGSECWNVATWAEPHRAM